MPDVLAALPRLTALRSLTVHTGGHNASTVANLSTLRWHPSLVELTLNHHHAGPKRPRPGLGTEELLPHRLTSLRMRGWGCMSCGLPINHMLAG